MTKLVVLTGSARPNSAGDKLLPIIDSAVKKHDDVELEIVHVADLNLPFFNAPMPPSAEGYEPTDANVIAWSEKIKAADAVIWLMPEYNHLMTGVQKNAIDWLYGEWKDKPLGLLGYGFYEGKHTIEAAKHVIDVIKPDLRVEAGLRMMEHIQPDGTAIQEDEVASRIQTVVDKVVA
ncbi:NAD(P)H-dependent oxidoreductase [Candidatus Saccharibacteria bacterium]|jgi:NAD(P)H-dependent FMN reductase|nr:NAD(P)H-dependent oxidoreductase [Candidatus Saccharibacteria bacterium]